MSLINPEKLKNSLKKIEKDLHQLLEPTTPAKPPFQVSLDFENDRFQIHTTDREEFYILLFSRLSNYFEKGFLLEANTNAHSTSASWLCSLHFSEGQLFVADPLLAVEFPIPSPGPHKVVKSLPAEWPLESKEWAQLIPQTPEWSALVFEVTADLRFLFCTRLAEPWLQVQTENAHKFIETASSVQP